jgi:hypothetical protein
MVGVSGFTVRAAEMEVPMDVQFPLFLKVATFDRNLSSRVGDAFVVAVLFQSRYRASLNAKDDFFDVMSRSQVNLVDGIPIAGVAVEYRDAAELEQLLIEHVADAVYITPLSAVAVDVITRVTRRLQIMSLSGVPPYIEQGVSVGVGIRRERPEIIINLSAARAEGIDFSSRLLNLARVVSTR